MTPCLDIAVYRKLGDRERAAYLARILPVTEEVAKLIVEYTFLDRDRLGLLLTDRAAPHPRALRKPRRKRPNVAWLGRPDEATRIIEVAARICRITVTKLEGPCRDAPVSQARAIASAALRRAGYTASAAARFLGGLDHTSVLTATKRAEARWPKLVDATLRVAAKKAGDE